MENKKPGIIGVGMVGGALKKYFEVEGNKPFVYDKLKNMGSIEDVNKADVIFLCVPTPFEGECNTSIVEEAIGLIEGEKIIVIKSTVIPGTTEKLQKQYPQHKFIFNPEFLTEVTADQDMRYPDRQIVGYTNESFDIALEVMQLLPLAPFEKLMYCTEAEMVKYAGNTWFSTKVIFANQIYDLCEKLGLQYDNVRDAIAPDKRIGRSHLEVWHKDYRGYSGACLPKDTKALIAFGDKVGVEMKLLKKVDELNNELTKE